MSEDTEDAGEEAKTATLRFTCTRECCGLDHVAEVTRQGAADYKRFYEEQGHAVELERVHTEGEE